MDRSASQKKHWVGAVKTPRFDFKNLAMRLLGDVCFVLGGREAAACLWIKAASDLLGKRAEVAAAQWERVRDTQSTLQIKPIAVGFIFPFSVLKLIEEKGYTKATKYRIELAEIQTKRFAERGIDLDGYIDRGHGFGIIFFDQPGCKNGTARDHLCMRLSSLRDSTLGC